jgi:hypothetical protein
MSNELLIKIANIRSEIERGQVVVGYSVPDKGIREVEGTLVKILDLGTKGGCFWCIDNIKGRDAPIFINNKYVAYFYKGEREWKLDKRHKNKNLNYDITVNHLKNKVIEAIVVSDGKVIGTFEGIFYSASPISLNTSFFAMVDVKVKNGKTSQNRFKLINIIQDNVVCFELIRKSKKVATDELWTYADH